MFKFTMRALEHFILDIKLDINIEFYRLLFKNKKI